MFSIILNQILMFSIILNPMLMFSIILNPILLVFLRVYSARRAQNAKHEITLSQYSTTLDFVDL